MIAAALTDDFRRRILDVHGEAGALWLDSLPAQLAALEDRWGIQARPPYALSYNYVSPADGPNGEAWVLKLCVPNPELTGEILALRHFDGQGAVKVIHSDPQAGVLLNERLQPGTPLSAVEDDQQATRIAAGVMKSLWREVPEEPGLRTVAHLGKGLQRLRQRFDGGCGPFPSELVELAESQLAQAQAAPVQPRLLHGDLHHDNILFDEHRGWLAIDPAGILGDPGYEVGSLLFNRLPGTPRRADLPRLLRRRLQLLSEELGIPLEQLQRWGIFKCVLSGWWDFEDHGRGWEEVIGVAQVLASL